MSRVFSVLSFLSFFPFLMRANVCEEEGPFAEESGCMYGCMYVTLEVLPILETFFKVMFISPDPRFSCVFPYKCKIMIACF